MSSKYIVDACLFRIQIEELKKAIKNIFYDFVNRKHLLTDVKDLLLKLKSPCFFIGARQYHINVKNHETWKTLRNIK